MKIGFKVELIKLDRNIDRLKVGAIGRIISMRDDGKDSLVKWEGKGGVVAHSTKNLKQIGGNGFPATTPVVTWLFINYLSKCGITVSFHYNLKKAWMIRHFQSSNL